MCSTDSIVPGEAYRYQSGVQTSTIRLPATPQRTATYSRSRCFTRVYGGDYRGCGVADTGHREAGAQIDQRVGVDVQEHPTAGRCDEHWRATLHFGRDRRGASSRQFPRPGTGQLSHQPTPLNKLRTGVIPPPPRHPDPGGEAPVSQCDGAVADQAGPGRQGEMVKIRWA